jgi:hypothetical protein
LYFFFWALSICADSVIYHVCIWITWRVDEARNQSSAITWLLTSFSYGACLPCGLHAADPIHPYSQFLGSPLRFTTTTFTPASAQYSRIFLSDFLESFFIINIMARHRATRPSIASVISTTSTNGTRSRKKLSYEQSEQLYHT